MGTARPGGLSMVDRSDGHTMGTPQPEARAPVSMEWNRKGMADVNALLLPRISDAG
jgi:hypothetical protein